ncbi:MAG: hypothetical protein RL536_652 [Candidatus Parcubacteria bacterium]
MQGLIAELKELLVLPFSEFKQKFTTVRTAERNFQLLVELASDVNAYTVVDLGGETPDTYRESFRQMSSLGILDEKQLPDFVKSSNLRNILTHEYDFDEDNFIFYKSLKEFVPLYESYLDSIKKHLASRSIGIKN